MWLETLGHFPRDASFSATARLRLAFLAPLVGAIVILLGVWVAVLYAEQRATIARETLQAQTLMEKAYRHDIVEHAGLLGAVMETLGHNAMLRAALARRDRDALLRLSAPTGIDLQRKFGITHFYFSGPDRVNLLRVHQPGRHGDVINRFTTLEAERTGATSYGMELGPLGTFTLRLVTPWYEGERLLGYVELGVELDYILQAEQVFSGVPLFPLIFKAQIKHEDWEVGMRMLGRVSDWARFADAVLSTQASAPMPAELMHRLAGGLPAMTAVVEVTQARTVYRAAFLTLADVSGRDVGRLVALIDVSPTLAASRWGLYLGTGLGALLAGLLIGLFHWLVGRLGRQLERHERELKRLATHDGLTGLRNHLEFYAVLASEIARGWRFGRPVSLLMLDVDHFKRVNDTHGHQAGDAVLKRLSELLCSEARTIDSVCRYGGEEIAVILPETDPDTAANIAERLRAAVEALPFDVNAGAPLHITASFGVASWPLHADNAQTLVAAADAAMYAAKRSGRNRVVRYGPAIEQPAVQE
jgi:diguanylate cyclase (GGDEF)-like protein